MAQVETLELAGGHNIASHGQGEAKMSMSLIQTQDTG